MNLTDIHMEAKKFANAADIADMNDWYTAFEKKYGELIIRECMAQARSVGDLRGATDDMIYGADIAALQISKHFGMNA